MIASKKKESNIRKQKIQFMILAFTTLLVIWELVARFTNASMFLPPASLIIQEFFKGFIVPIGKYTIPVHTLISLYRVGVAFLIAATVGIMLGVAMGYSKVSESIFKPLFELIRPIPPLAWIPMSILWFGIGDQSKFFIIFLGCFTFITVNAYDGTKKVDKTLIGAAKMLGASDRHIFTHIIIPSVIPNIFTGLQIAITAGWSAVVGAEMVRSDEGVGWLIVMGMTRGNTVQIMVGMLAIGVIGFLLVIAIEALERKICKWELKSEN